MPLAWGELEAAVERGSAHDRLGGPDEALDRVSDQGDVFAPVLTLVERLPDLGP
jgi:bifunctional non-homologous end joining protein LigD